MGVNKYSGTMLVVVTLLIAIVETETISDVDTCKFCEALSCKEANEFLSNCLRRVGAVRTSRELHDASHGTSQRHGRLRNGDEDITQRRGDTEFLRRSRTDVQEWNIGNVHVHGKQ